MIRQLREFIEADEAFSVAEFIGAAVLLPGALVALFLLIWLLAPYGAVPGE